MSIYLDHNATAPLRAEARAAMQAAFDCVGNPSSVHAEGRKARAMIEAARSQIVDLMGGCAGRICFTSGGTEANALGVLGGARSNGVGRLIISAIEHDAVRGAADQSGLPVEGLRVDETGLADLDHLKALLEAGPKALVALMAVNNETGVIQPVSDAATLVREAGGLLHVDAVQAAGRIPLGEIGMMADFVALSAHKIGGPKGAGALHIAKARDVAPLLTGGGQELGDRAGTENLPGIAGFGAAAQAALKDLDDQDRIAALRDRLEDQLTDATVMGKAAPRVANTTALLMRGAKAETQVMAFDLEGICVSAGSACSSGKVGPSHVMAAMGLGDEDAQSVVRVSLGPQTSGAEIETFCAAWRAIHGRLAKRASAA